jgi:hypothetical protein
MEGKKRKSVISVSGIPKYSYKYVVYIFIIIIYFLFPKPISESVLILVNLAVYSIYCVSRYK